MSDATTPNPPDPAPVPLGLHRVTIEFDVRARDQDEARYLVSEVLIEDLAGPPDQLRTDGDRVFGERFGDEVSHIVSWIPAPGREQQRPARDWVFVPSREWEPFEGTGLPEIVAEMFPPEPRQADYLLPNGEEDPDGFEDAHQAWREECLSLAVSASRLPSILTRLKETERVRDGLIDLLEREPLPDEPQRDDYLVTVSPAYEGEYEDMRYRSDHAQWRADFTAVARRRDYALDGLLAEGGPRTMYLPEKFYREWVPSDLIAIHTLRALVEREKSGPGAPMMERTWRERLESMLYTTDPDVQVIDPDDPERGAMYVGQASEAHEWLPPGVYDATGRDGDGEFRLVVGRVPIGDGVTASAAFPPAEHDSAAMNEIARILEHDTETHDPAAVIARINDAIQATGRVGALPGEFENHASSPTRLEHGVLLSELLAERETHLDPPSDNDPGAAPPTRGPSRDL